MKRQQLCDDTNYVQATHEANMRLARIFHRLFSPTAERLERGREADHEFSFGEYGGEYHEQLWQDAWDAAVEAVAKYTGRSIAEVDHALNEYESAERDAHEAWMRRMIDNGCLEAYYGF